MIAKVGYQCQIAIHKLWWRLMPGTVISVKWPVGPIDQMAFGKQLESADPNDHYRPWMEANVGTQCWDWDWDVVGNDIANNRLTVKFRRGKERYAIEAALRWS